MARAKGKSAIVASDNTPEPNSPFTEQDMSSEPSTPQGVFRFMDLPAEIRVSIYSYLLPHNVMLCHRLHGGASARSGKWRQDLWLVDVLDKTTQVRVPFSVGRVLRSAPKVGSLHPSHKPRNGLPTTQVQLFHVNKEISNEARAVLYGTNTYKFTVDGSAHFPKSMTSPLVFGPFGNEDGAWLYILRNLRSIRIDCVIDLDSHWAVKRQRSRLEYFVTILKQHADDENRKSLLEDLHVHFRIKSTDQPPASYGHRYLNKISKPSETFMFGLESLATLRGIKDVRITGVPQWFAQCLTLAIQGKGGDVLDAEWPQEEVKRTKLTDSGNRKTKKAWVSKRQWWQPVLEWREFAMRNGVELPKDIDSCWEVDGPNPFEKPKARRIWTHDPRDGWFWQDVYD